jgi:hypothetical protein
MTTTNGTPALLATQAASVYLAAAANLSAAVAAARDALTPEEFGSSAPAGRSFASTTPTPPAGRGAALAAAGSGLGSTTPSPSDPVRGAAAGAPLRASRGGSDLVALGFDADLVDAAREDAYPVLPVYHERRITAAPAASSCDRRRRRRLGAVTALVPGSSPA